jgi:hypothetical protein
VILDANPWLAVVLAIFATWRVTHLLAREDGPFYLLARLRARMGQGFAGTLMDCFHCLSMWIAAPCAFALTRDPVEWTVTWLGLSGAACLIERHGEKPVAFHPLPNATANEDSLSYELLRTPTNSAANPRAATPDSPSHPGA